MLFGLCESIIARDLKFLVEIILFYFYSRVIQKIGGNSDFEISDGKKLYNSDYRLNSAKWSVER